MALTTPGSKRHRFRQWFSSPRSTRGSIPVSSATLTPQSNASGTSTATQRDFQGRVFLLLPPQDQDTIRQHTVPNARDVDAIVQQALTATRQKQAICQAKRWVFTFRGHTVVLRDKADNIVKWIERFKQAGDIASNADPVHVGLPWAGIRLLLEAAVSEQNQMATLLLGLETSLYLSHRLQVYMGYWAILPASPARVNFESCLVEFHALILRFLAGAIRIYQKSSLSRGLEAFWRIQDVSSFEENCNKMASRAEIEASNCDRDLSAIDRAEAKQQQEDLRRSLKRLEAIHTIQIHLSTISQSIDNKLDQNRDDQILRTISHVGDAAYNSYENQRHRLCLGNTRVSILQDIINWATSNSDQYIYWLKGRAGTGKSTIALTIAQSLHQRGTILASFFFKRGGGDLARSRKMISTIAFQLAFQSRLLGSFICDALRDDPSLSDSASLSEQYHKLLLHPLQRIQRSTPGPFTCVAVLDALDECDDIDDVRLFLTLLGNIQTMVGLGLCLLVTSRPETPIRLGFHQMKHIAYHELALHDVPRAILDQDIKTFVTHELALIRVERGLPDAWPGDDKIQTITARADGLFIYAATVCRFVNGPRQIRVSDRLEQVCQGNRARHKSTEALDEMYLVVLDSSMKGDFSADEAQDVTTRLRHLVGSVVLLYDNLSAEELERLLFPSLSTGGTLVQDTLDPLHAILDVPEDRTKPVKMQHLSFRDFLVDSSRCPDPRFHINERDGHRKLSTHCLDLMTRSLRQNICCLPGPGTLVSEVSEAILDQYIPPGLRYACRHWITHAEHGEESLDDGGRVYSFLLQYSPYWWEVISLIGKIPEAMGMMRKLENLVKLYTHKSSASALQCRAFLQPLWQHFSKVVQFFDI
ncbi:uncharacterized protein Z518_10759 [Rhinocladiella mackenziei CBS 650.93]|uniref:Rhinocladiella mackenziei CBS 650.93 unplaced genomic scaffold supercont1.10, whole genome shotgun sequence n=1 Tax=Rhinocladiella mackenziei CBS 650.93 TaxID=1442369 RepID=A0A0D2FCK5_9EURO|nr:uncharacterized protein Z518_10759 [Rhinocladiella mackenziei CBS 650.93]KIW99831.1 hypothetical protein Z518_10759 [Rhinocladiella mackenziei CBS 650.93]